MPQADIDPDSVRGDSGTLGNGIDILPPQISREHSTSSRRRIPARVVESPPPATRRFELTDHHYQPPLNPTFVDPRVPRTLHTMTSPAEQPTGRRLDLDVKLAGKLSEEGVDNVTALIVDAFGGAVIIYSSHI